MAFNMNTIRRCKACLEQLTLRSSYYGGLFYTHEFIASLGCLGKLRYDVYCQYIGRTHAVYDIPNLDEMSFIAKE